MTIEQELAKLTDNFTEDNVAVRCWTKNEKYNAIDIFKQHYNIVDVSDGRGSADEKLSWVIAASEPKQLKETLTEADETFDLDPDDDFDLSDLNTDSIQDSTDIANADQITVLKARAADLAKKWQDTYKQINELAKKLDLVVSHDEDLKITIDKADGSKADLDKDLDKVATAIDSLDSKEQNEEIDDSFGPSEYDDRAALLPPDIKVESLDLEKPAVQTTESYYPWNKDNGTNDLGQSNDPDELSLDINDVDDDF